VLHEQLLTHAAFSADRRQAALKIQAGWEGGGDVDLTDDQMRAALLVAVRFLRSRSRPSGA
jgi:hypothetical protein